MFGWKADTCQAHKLVYLGESLNFGGALDLSQQFSLFLLLPPSCSGAAQSPALLPPLTHLPFAFCLWHSIRAARCSSSLFKTLYAFTLLSVTVDTSLRLHHVFPHCKTGTAGLAHLVRRSSTLKAGGTAADLGDTGRVVAVSEGCCPSCYLQSGGSAEPLGKIK